MRRRIPRGARLARFAWRTRLGFEKVRGGAWLLSSLTRVSSFRSPDERSDIREQLRGFTAAPQVSLRSPGLRRKLKEAERRQTQGTNRRILRMRRALFRSAHACRRSTTALT